MNHRRTLQRISGEDAAIAEQVLNAAIFLMLPEKTKSRFFVDQIESIQQLRKNGLSWAQIKNMLADSGINFSESTLRSYHSRITNRRER